MDEYYNHHYIRTDASGNIAEGWSDGPHNGRKPTEEDILINDKGGYQFRLILDGKTTEENPALYDFGTMIPLYKWTGSEVVRRSEAEIEADRAAIFEEQKQRARIAALKAQLAATDYAVIKIAEGAASAEDYADVIAQRQAWRAEINALEMQENIE